MTRTETVNKKADEFIGLARGKGYRDETIEIAFMLACSVDMHEKVGDTPIALDKAIELCKQYNNGSEFIKEYIALIGY